MGSGKTLFWSIILQLFLILISACFSLAEISLLTINRNKLEGQAKKGNKKARYLFSLTGEPAKFLATIQVGNTLTGFLGSAFAAENFSGMLTAFLVSTGIGFSYNTLSTISVIAIILLLSYFTMVFSELFPKRVALKKAETLAFVFYRPIQIISRLFSPVVWILSSSTNALLRLLGIDPKAGPGKITEEDIRLMIDLGSSVGTIKSNEKEFLHNVFEFDNKSAGEVMTHRRDAVFLCLDDEDSEWERIIAENRHNFFPVCGEGPDDIRGILNVRDYLLLNEKSRAAVMKILRPPRFVPLTVRTDILFRQMKKSRNHFAITVDEHGSVMGIVTMNDLLEELVGDLEDDSTVPLDRPLIEKTGKDEWYINGAASLDMVARELDFNLPVMQYDTFAGFVFSLLGSIPEDGAMEELEFSEPPDSVQTAANYPGNEGSVPTKIKITLLEVKERRLERALVRKVQKESS